MTTRPQLVQSAPPYTEQAQQLIRSFILEGVYPPGGRLSELALSHKLGISRSPVREALQRLANEGLIELVSRKGAFVVHFDAERVQALFEVREALDGMVARLAAQRAEPADLQELRKTLGNTKAILDRSEESSYPEDLDFHRQLAVIAKNRWLAEKMAEIETQVRLARARSGARPSRAKDAYAEHLAILNAVAAGDPDKAEHEMRQHIRNALGSVRETLSEPSSVKRTRHLVRSPE